MARPAMGSGHCPASGLVIHFQHAATKVSTRSLIFASRSWRTWRRSVHRLDHGWRSCSQWGKSCSGLLPPPPEPFHLPSTPFNSPWSATTRSRASRYGVWLEGRLALYYVLSHVLAMASRCAICCGRVPSLSFMGTKDARLRWVASTPRRLAWTSPRF
jgi:hypothetical protein